MTVRNNTTPHDHIPETFTLESLREGGMTDQEIEAAAAGDDPLVILPADDAAPDAEVAPPATVGTAPEVTPAAAPAPVVADPKPAPMPDTSAAEAAIEGLQAALDKAADDYDDGNLTRAEFTKIQRETAQALARAQMPIMQAEQQAADDQAKVQQHWFSRLDAYKAQSPELWSDEHIKGWDASLREVTSNPAYADMPRDQQIALAHKRYALDHEARTGKALPAAKAPAKDPGAKLEVRTDPRPDPVSTLAGHSSDSTADVADATFAAIDRTIMTDPIAAEKMLERLSPEDRERYLAV